MRKLHHSLKTSLLSFCFGIGVAACQPLSETTALSDVDTDKNKETPTTQPLTNLEPEIGLASITGCTTETHFYKPKSDGPYPVIYFLQGYPCRTINPAHSKSKSRAKLISLFVSAGYAVFLAEKPGMGELSDQASTDLSCEKLTYPQEVAAFSGAFNELLNREDINPKQVYLFGHSMGGQTAPILAQNHDVAGIITYGIHSKPWFEFMIDISRAQSERLGMDPVKAQADTQLFIPFLYDLMIAKEDWDILTSRHADALELGLMSARSEQLNGRHYTFWSSLNDTDFVKAWGDYNGHVLAMYGAYDIASISPEGAERIANIVNYHNPNKARTVLIPKTGHTFAKVNGSFDDYKAQRFSRDWTDEKETSLFNPTIGEEVLSWIEEIEAD